MSTSTDHKLDITEDVLLRIIANSGTKTGKDCSAAPIRSAFERLWFPTPFAEVVDSLTAKGLVGRDGETIHLTAMGLARTRS